MSVHPQRPQQPWQGPGGQQFPGPPGGPPPMHQQPGPPPPPPPPPSPGGRDSTAMTVLRVTAYVLTSIASLLFIIVVIYGMVKINQLQDSIANSPFGGGLGGTSSYDGTFGG